MPLNIQLEQTAALRALLEKLRHLPEVAVKAIIAGMDEAGKTVLGQAVFRRFTGIGPFPVDQHRLGVRTQLLRKSLTVFPPRLLPDRVTVRQPFGSNVKYFAVHEFGFQGAVTVRGHTRQRKGKPTKKGVKTADKGAPIFVKPHTRNLTIAARAPLSTELGAETTRGSYFRAIGRKLRLELNTLEGGRA